MPLYLDEIRSEFAKFLSENANVRFSLDKALAYVVEKAYQQGVEDGQKDLTE